MECAFCHSGTVCCVYGGHLAQSVMRSTMSNLVGLEKPDGCFASLNIGFRRAFEDHSVDGKAGFHSLGKIPHCCTPPDVLRGPLEPAYIG